MTTASAKTVLDYINEHGFRPHGKFFNIRAFGEQHDWSNNGIVDVAREIVVELIMRAVESRDLTSEETANLIDWVAENGLNRTVCHNVKIGREFIDIRYSLDKQPKLCILFHGHELLEELKHEFDESRSYTDLTAKSIQLLVKELGNPQNDYTYMILRPERVKPHGNKNQVNGTYTAIMPSQAQVTDSKNQTGDIYVATSQKFVIEPSLI